MKRALIGLAILAAIVLTAIAGGSSDLLPSKIIGAGIDKRGGITYLLRDEFTSDLAAGSVNGTAAEPGPGTRVVTDTGSQLSLVSGNLAIAAGAAQPGLWLDSAARTAGKLLIQEWNNASGGLSQMGWAANGTTVADNAWYLSVGTSVYSVADTNYTVSHGVTLSGGTPYRLIIVQKTAGAYYLIKGGALATTLLWSDPRGTGANLRPGWKSYANAAVLSSSYGRVPTATWLPTPLAYDTFTRANGALGSTETTGPDGQTTPALVWVFDSGIWTVAGNKAVGTPTIGGNELYTDADSMFDSGTGIWAPYGANTVANDAGTLKITYVDNANGADGTVYNGHGLSAAPSAGLWYRYSFDAKVNAGSSVNVSVYDPSSGQYIGNVITGTSFATFTNTFRGSTSIGPYTPGMGAGEIVWLDNLSVRSLTTSTLFSSVVTSTADVLASVNVTAASGYQAGLVLNLDSESNPQNFIIAYVNSATGRVMLEQCVAGVYTVKINAVVTYSAGASLVVVRDGTACRVYYSNTMVGTQQTMAANVNTKHGLFSTNPSNTLDNVLFMARGTGGEYEALDSY